jgi:hypothetical protein
MSRRLVKTIQATQVRTIERPSVDTELTSVEIERLEALAARFQVTLELRRAGLTPLEVSRLEFVRWDRSRNFGRKD